MALSDYVAVSISLASAVVTKPAFSVMLILGYTSSFSGTRTYTSLAGVANDFPATAAEYQAAEAAFSQNPAPQQLKIGKAAALVAGAGNVTLLAAPAAGQTLNLTVDGQPVSVEYSTSAAATMTALAAAIAALPGIASAIVDAVNPEQVDVTGALGYPFSLTNASVSGAGAPTITATVTTASVTQADSLTTIQQADDAWYGLVVTDPSDANILNVAAWIEAQMKVFGVASTDAAIIASGTADIASELKAKGYTRTFLLYHSTADEFADAAWVASQLANAPGSATWDFKTLRGVTPDTLTAAQIANAKGKNANVYIAVAGVDITDPGVMGAGPPRFIDITVGVDWLQSSIQTDVFALLASTPKVPYTDAGAQQVASVIRADLNRAITAGVLADDGSVKLTVPKVADQAANDRGNRYFPDITFVGNLAGAIQKVQIQGTVSV